MPIYNDNSTHYFDCQIGVIRATHNNTTHYQPCSLIAESMMTNIMENAKHV